MCSSPFQMKWKGKTRMQMELFREMLKILKNNFFKEQSIVKENRGFLDLR